MVARWKIIVTIRASSNSRLLFVLSLSGAQFFNVHAGTRFEVRFENNTEPIGLASRFLCFIPFPWLAIRTVSLGGEIDTRHGSVKLHLHAEMSGALLRWRSAPLVIISELTTERIEAPGDSSGTQEAATGAPLDATGRCTLVALCRIPRTASRVANWLLRLPALARAELPAVFEMRRSAGAPLRSHPLVSVNNLPS